MSWQQLTLGDLIELENGYAFKSDEYVEYGHFLMRIANVQQGYISKQAPKYVSIPNGSNLVQFELNEGDMLMSLTGNVGRVGIIEKQHLPAALNQRVARIKIKDASKLDKGYLFIFLSTDDTRLKIEKLANGAAQLNVSAKDVKSITIPVPPLAQQKRIAAILDKAAEIKAKREQAIAKLDELAQSTFVEMFGTNPSNSSNGQLVKLSDLCDLQNGYAFKSTDYVESSSVLNCRMSNIRPNGDFDIFYSAKYLPNSFAEKHKSFLLADGDVIIAMTDMAGEPKILGVPTIVETNGYKLLLNQRVGKLTFNKNKNISIVYLKYALSQTYVKKYYRQFAGGGVQINLGKSDLLSINLLLPNDDEQMKFEKKIKFIEQQKMKHLNALSVCSATQLSLQHQAFTTGFDA